MCVYKTQKTPKVKNLWWIELLYTKNLQTAFPISGRCKISPCYLIRGEVHESGRWFCLSIIINLCTTTRCQQLLKGQSLSASLALLVLMTLYNNDSHLFSILLNPSPPASVMLQALDRLTDLRMGSRPRGTLSQELSTIGRPHAPLGRVLPVEGQIMSWFFSLMTL